MPLFIEHRHDHGNGGRLLIVHGSSGVRGSGSPRGGRLVRRYPRPRYRQWGTRFRPARVAEPPTTAWGRRQFIVWAYGVPGSSPVWGPIVAEVSQ
ncbi:hypothetical protein GCM10018779_55880 [Streptomyces griseocarneus]|nr:hypothetical protein GCM10018779_55880 [Streptomyces griseocarneus]